MALIITIAEILQAGLGSLAAYLAAHVLLCLLPAFFIAGALMTLIPKEAITHFLGKDAPKWISYPMAAIGGFVLAVCSCTIMPLFASIYKKGGGLGPAITFLFVGPAVNILAISFTGVQIGMDIAIARISLSLIFGILIGLIMVRVFRKDEEQRQETNNSLFEQSAHIPTKNIVFFLLLIAVLISGTLQTDLLSKDLISFEIDTNWAGGLEEMLGVLVPTNESLGIEGVSIHGVILIGLLILISLMSIKGLNYVDEGFNRWTFTVLATVSLTLLFATLQMKTIGQLLTIGVTGRFIAQLLLIGSIWIIAKRFFNNRELGVWLWEVWRFVKQIMPLLLVGVFLAGIARALIPANWIENIAGENTFLANLTGVLFGVFMYFPTLVEVPVAQTFLSLGMHRGPLLAYLLSDPELSLQSIIIINSVIGKKKTGVYVILVTIFSTLSGLLFGWIISNL